MPRPSRLVPATLCLVGAVALSSCADYEAPDLTARDPIQVQSETPSARAGSTDGPTDGASASADPTPSRDSRPPAARAVSAALAQTRGGAAIGLERVDDQPSWQVTVVDRQGRELTVLVVGSDEPRAQAPPVTAVEDDDDRADNVQLARTVGFDLARVVTRAGGAVRSAVLDEDDDLPVWEVELVDGRELLVDARSGVVRVED